MRATDVG